jgi:hypothetical protein
MSDDQQISSSAAQATALRAALARTGVRYDDNRTAAAPRHDRVELDLKAASDVELIAEVLHYRSAVAQISADLDLDREQGGARGERWKSAAGRARALYRERLKLMEAEGVLRGLPQAMSEQQLTAHINAQGKAERHAAHKQLVAEHAVRRQRKDAEAAAWRAERLEQDARLQRQAQTDKERFYQAATRVLSGDQIEAIWARAREMFPDEEQKP